MSRQPPLARTRKKAELLNFGLEDCQTIAASLPKNVLSHQKSILHLLPNITMGDSCGEPVTFTVTVTQTTLQGAATSTTTTPANPLPNTGEASVTSDDGSNQPSSSDPSSTADDQASAVA